ncbi:MAG: hypothetical protein H0V07_02380 [Propionibacteriales bacterium]|nr:hypothetical protein [Propionibacteriales bacterium]
MEQQEGGAESGYATRPLLVMSEKEFVRNVQDGDVLLFDKLSPLNRLVQWGDNRPVGHAGIWYGDGIYEATMKPLPSGGTKDGVFHTPFSELMGLRARDARGEVGLVRTVTAMRHPGMARQALDRIKEYLEECRSAGFGALDMLLLTPFALERSKAVGEGRLSAVMKGTIQACAYYAKKQAISPDASRQNVFCSQLVYRAYEHAGLSIDISEALYERYHSRPHLTPFQRDGAAGLDEDEIEEIAVTALLDEYQEFFEQEVVSNPNGLALAPSPTDDQAAPEPLAGLSFRRGGSPSERTARALQLGDMVTPGDFWTSPSLKPAVVLHRPSDA